MSQRRQHCRYRYFADVKIQGGLCVRVAAYWFICQLSFAATIAGLYVLNGFQVNYGGPSPWGMIVSATLVSSLLLPIALFDLIVFSNRFAGPLLRLRRQARAMARSEPTGDFALRRGDYLEEMCQDMSAIAGRLNQFHPVVDEEDDADATFHRRMLADEATLVL